MLDVFIHFIMVKYILHFEYRHAKSFLFTYYLEWSLWLQFSEDELLTKIYWNPRGGVSDSNTDYRKTPKKMLWPKKVFSGRPVDGRPPPVRGRPLWPTPPPFRPDVFDGWSLYYFLVRTKFLVNIESFWIGKQSFRYFLTSFSGFGTLTICEHYEIE